MDLREKAMSIKQGLIEPLQLLPHARELQNYLITLAAAMTGKKKPPADYIHDLKPHSKIFVSATNISDITKHIRTIFQEKGYRTPWDLENDIIRDLRPDIPEAAITYADHYAASELAPDPMTGFYQKTQVPLTMALAALYAQSTGNPVSVIEIDFSNMRGTNEHFEKLLAAAEGTPTTGFIRHEAMHFTDRATLITASAIRNTVTDALGDKTRSIVALRTGGDEVRIVLPDVNIAQASALVEKIHDAIEDVTARLDLHDHSHSKRPLDVLSNGFGACAAVFELKNNGQSAYEDSIRMADRQIQESKIDLGRKRLGNPLFDQLKPSGLRSPDCYRDRETARTHLTAVLGSIAGLQENLGLETAPESKTPSFEEMLTTLHPDHFLTIAQIHSTFFYHLKTGLEESGISLSPAQERILQIKANRFPAIDHATGTLMARDLPAVAGAAAKITAGINGRAGRSEPLWTLGASFHNLSGLNEALGHEAANTILHRQAHDVLEESLFRAGIARENFYLAHMGGGEFRAVILPVIIDADGSTRIIDRKTMNAVCDMVRQKTKDLNKDYADIENPREELRPWENGITVTTVASPYKINPQRNTNENRRGGAIIAFIGETLAEEIQSMRKNYVPPFPARKMTPDMF